MHFILMNNILPSISGILLLRLIVLWCCFARMNLLPPGKFQNRKDIFQTSFYRFMVGIYVLSNGKTPRKDRDKEWIL